MILLFNEITKDIIFNGSWFVVPPCQYKIDITFVAYYMHSILISNASPGSPSLDPYYSLRLHCQLIMHAIPFIIYCLV